MMLHTPYHRLAARAGGPLRRRCAVLLSSLAAIGLAAAVAVGEEQTPGRAEYLRYCSACHGDGGRGDGIVSGMMQPRPIDLTQLARQHGGDFPFLHVREAIDGRKQPHAHGDSAMPVWGDVLSTQKAMAQGDAHVRGQVQAITDYLATIQAE